MNNKDENEKKKEDESDDKKKEKKKVKWQFTLPWWCKIIGYVLSVIFVGVSIFFVIVKGITFGDEKCRKWLTSFIVSILTSCFITQPIQVYSFLNNRTTYYYCYY